MAKIRWVDGDLRVYSRWYSKNNFSLDKKYLKSKEVLIEWFWKTNPSRVHASLSFLEEYCKENDFKNIVSFGSGLCTLEYLLWKYLSKFSDVFMVASDMEKRTIDVADALFPEIECVEFDFYNHSFRDLKDRYGVDFDFAFMIDSTYSMNADAFVHFFKELRENELSNIVDFCGGIVSHKRYPREYLYRLYNGFNYILTGELANPESYIPVDRPFGYGRTRSDLIRLYNEAGYRVVNEPVIDGIKYVAVLQEK